MGRSSIDLYSNDTGTPFEMIFDLDFRADQWHDLWAYGVNVRALLPLVNVAIGAEEEVNAAMVTDPTDIVVRDQQISAPEIRGDLDENLALVVADAERCDATGYSCPHHFRLGATAAASHSVDAVLELTVRSGQDPHEVVQPRPGVVRIVVSAGAASLERVVVPVATLLHDPF